MCVWGVSEGTVLHVQGVLHIIRQTNAYNWLVRRKGQKEVRENLREKGVGPDGSENESNLQGTRRCENEKMCCKLCTGEKVKHKEAGGSTWGER